MDLTNREIEAISAAVASAAAVAAMLIKHRKHINNKTPPAVIRLQRDLDQVLDFYEDDLLEKDQTAAIQYRLRSIAAMRERLRKVTGD